MHRLISKNAFHFGTSFIECILPFNIFNKEKYYRMIGNFAINDAINDTVNLILKLIKENQKTTIEELMKKANKSIPMITQSIAKLKDLGYIERVSSDKTGYWKIK